MVYTTKTTQNYSQGTHTQRKYFGKWADNLYVQGSNKVLKIYMH